MKKAKIIATLGPASDKATTIKRLAKAGMDICRLNFSFGTHEGHQEKVDLIRKVSRETGKSLAILQDLQGPKIRVGKLKAPVTVKNGQKLTLSGKSDHKETFRLPTTYKNIASDTKPGKTILMADGRIILKVIDSDKSKKEVYCKVLNGGTILTGKGINLPYTDISLPALTPKDRQDAIFGARAGVDYMGLSFVRQAEDVLKLRRLLKKEKKDIPIIAKIEKPEALDNLEEILDVVDGVMVARGDLADEISFARVPVAQKDIIRRANKKGKITIVATEMLSSMTENPLPTRAEVSDVANAVLDGADAVMLSNESATGKFPVKAVKTMSEIISEAETLMDDGNFHLELDLPEVHELNEAMCSTASFLSYYLDERALVVITPDGTYPYILSMYRPQSNIFAATFDENVYRKMAFYHNVHPILLNQKQEKKQENVHRYFDSLEVELREKKLVKSGNTLIFLTGKLENKGWKSSSISVRTVS